MNQDLQNAIAARDAILRKAGELAERAASLTAAKAVRDQAQAEVDAIARAETDALNEWAKGGAVGKAPVADARAREAALRKLAAAHESARAVDAALAELERQNAELARELGSVQEAVKTSAATYLAGLHAQAMAEQRALEDKLAVSRVICAGTFQMVSGNDARVATQAAKSLEDARLAWVNRRDAEIEAAVSEQWSKLTAGLPA